MLHGYCTKAALVFVALGVLVGGCSASAPDAGTASASGVSTTGGGSSAMPACESGQQPCGTSCVDVSTDTFNCGACNVLCGLSQVCSSGTCVCTGDTSLCASTCAHLPSDPNNCGQCGNVCPEASPFCSNGACSTSCAEGQTACGLSCVDTTQNNLHCGACDAACGAGSSCTNGGCSCPEGECDCPAGQLFCAGECVDVQSDPSHCGACDTSCNGLQCVDGACASVKACFNKTTVTAPLVTDFEAYDGTMPVDTWGFAFNAPAGDPEAVYAGVYQYNDETGSPTLGMVEGNGSTYALGIENTQASAWGGAVALWMTCVDASEYTGLSFWARGSVPGGTASFILGTEDTSPPDENDPAAGGTCDADCEAPSATFGVSEDWTRVVVPWSSFTGGSANGASVSVTGDNITGLTASIGLEWTEDPEDPENWIPVPASYDFEIDDIEFLTGTGCPAAETVCGSACVDTQSDDQHCGRCDDPCLAGSSCTDGLCTGGGPEGDAADMAADMGFGANIGNSLDSTAYWETGWGLPPISQQFINGMADNGIKTVRLPVAWDTYAENGVIPSDKLARVREVVGWIVNAGMYCILNIHWDGGWIRSEGTGSQYTLTNDVRTKFQSYWQQIAAEFVNVDSRLVLEALNEEGEFYINGNQNGGPDYAPLNELNQSFVDTVRAAGGHNETRNLLIAGFLTDIERTTVAEFGIPTDPAGAGKLFLSIHYYTPFAFTLATDGTARTTWGTAAEETELENLFTTLAEFSNDRNIPVILGEFTATPGSGQNTRDSASRILWLRRVIETSRSWGMVPVLWDIGEDISRTDGSLSSDLTTVMTQVGL